MKNILSILILLIFTSISFNLEAQTTELISLRAMVTDENGNWTNWFSNYTEIEMTKHRMRINTSIGEEDIKVEYTFIRKLEYVKETVEGYEMEVFSYLMVDNEMDHYIVKFVIHEKQDLIIIIHDDFKVIFAIQ